MRAKASTLFALLLLLGRALLPGESAFAQQGSDDEAQEAGDSADSDPTGEVDATESDADEPPADDYELPDDLDAIDAGDDDWELPDDLDEGEGGDDEWDFDAALEEADENPPLRLPILGETTFSLTSTTRAQYRFDNFDANTTNDDFFSAWERLEGAMQGEELRIGARLDFFLPLGESDCPDGADPNQCIDSDIRLERFSVHWDHDAWTLDAVDSYAILGRGIALSFRRLDILGVDTALRGGQVAYDNDAIYFKALGGAVNPQNLDPNTLAIIRRPADRLRRDLWKDPGSRDWVLGGELGYRLPGFEIGAHAARYWFADDSESGLFTNETDLDIFGWHLELPQLAGGRVAFYGEADISQRQSERNGEPNGTGAGRAIYASLQIEASERATIALEWKDYRRFYVADDVGADAHRVYSALPDLEGDYERPENQSNARGGRFQLDYGFLPGDWGISASLLSYGHAEHRESAPVDEGDPWSRDGFWLNHLQLKLQKVIQGDPGAFGWTFDLLGGYRDDRYLGARDGRQGGDLHWRVVHGQVETGVVFGEHSFELSVLHRQEAKWNFSIGDLDHFVRGSASVTYSWHGRIRVAPVLAWNNEKSGVAPVLYPGLEGRVDFMDGSFVRVFGGLQPGGRVCSGGVCRDVPLFKGALAELVLRL